MTEAASIDSPADETGEAELRARFDLREEAFAHRDFRVRMLLPRAADALIDEAEFEADERMPYWADLWPSARGLTRHLLDRPPSARRIVELGAGVALPSLALRSLGADPLATDYYADALRFAEANARRNGFAPLRTALLDWRDPPANDQWDLIVAADVVYEQRNGEAVAELLPRILADGGQMLLADPGRAYFGEFRDRMEEMDWAVEEIDVRTETSDPVTGATSTVRIWRVAVEGVSRGGW
ncbi:MAG TPA: methyltransferase domain-containing protein [Longimicrobium sp.]|jgi:predicted nicotinamide N-methyase|nr:methyltransferase domain-containing protein [Longimicrobium sp.]